MADPRTRGQIRGLGLAAAAVGAVWALRAFVSIITPGNPNPYLTPLAVLATLAIVAVPAVGTGRLVRSRWGFLALIFGTACAASGVLAAVVPAEFALHRGALLVHFVTGTLGLLPAHLYLVGHLRDAVRRRPVDLVRGGGVALLGVLAALWTGAAILVLQARDVAFLEGPHALLGGLAVVVSVLHGRRGRAVLARRETPEPLRSRLVLGSGLGLGITALAVVHAGVTGGPGPWEGPTGVPQGDAFTGARTVTGERLDGGVEHWAAATCSSPGGYCHIDNVTQWKRTTHARSTNPAFEAVFDVFEVEQPGRAGYCDSCHRPRRAVSMEGPEASPPKTLRENGPTIPPVAPHEGLDAVGCAVCHRARLRHEAPHTGGWVAQGVPRELVAVAAVPFFNFPLVLADIERHGKLLLESPRADAEAACGTCHTHRVPDAIHPGGPNLLVADKVTPWREGPYGKLDSPDRQTCVDCHMPRVYGPADPTWTRSHAFPSGNVGVPWLLGDDARAQEAAAFAQDRVTLDASCTGTICTVTVTNTGVGHPWPAGPRDMEDTWLRARLVDMDGTVLWSRGEDSEETGDGAPVLDWSTELFDAADKRLDRHEFWSAVREEGLPALAAGASEEATFRVPGAGTLELTVLRRRYNPRFQRALLPDHGAAPIVPLASARVLVR